MHKLALQLAASNPARIKMAAVVTNKRSRVLSTGLNSYTRTHTIQKRFGGLTGRSEAIYLHAEMAALVKCREKPHTLYVARITRNNEHGISKPCPACMLGIKEAGVKRIVYFNKAGEEVKEWV